MEIIIAPSPGEDGALLRYGFLLVKWQAYGVGRNRFGMYGARTAGRGLEYLVRFEGTVYPGGTWEPLDPALGQAATFWCPAQAFTPPVITIRDELLPIILSSNVY